MKLGDFLESAMDRGVIISNITDMGWAWAHHKDYAELTSLIDFECGFDENGICKIRQRPGRKGKKPSKADLRHLSKNCCSGCSYEVGYLRSLPNNIIELQQIAELFNKRDGFWRPGKGCTLPRKYRSNTCLFHMCRRHLSKSREGDPLELLRDMMYTPCEPDYYHSYSPLPKTFKGWSNLRGKSSRRRWISVVKMRKRILEDNKKRKRKASNGDN